MELVRSREDKLQKSCTTEKCIVQESRNVLRVTVDVPGAGEVNFHCTHLDHLDEGLRMKQVDSILRSADGHHILAGGLNALDPTDYSADHWANIVKV